MITATVDAISEPIFLRDVHLMNHISTFLFCKKFSSSDHKTCISSNIDVNALFRFRLQCLSVFCMDSIFTFYLYSDNIDCDVYAMLIFILIPPAFIYVLL